MILQLNPPIPMAIVGGHDWAGPTGDGMAILVLDNGPDHHLVWTIVLDATGQVWSAENPNVRARPNITWGRPSPDRPPGG